MAALTQDRPTPYREGAEYVFPVAAGAKIYAGALVMLDAAGNATPASAASQLTAAGIAVAQVDNTGGAAGEKTVGVKKGTFRFENGEALTQADVGKPAFALDDQTVGTTATGRSPVGVITEVEAGGVWVHIPPRLTPAAANPDTTGALLADLEIEVNELKAALRAAGILSA